RQPCCARWPMPVSRCSTCAIFPRHPAASSSTSPRDAVIIMQRLDNYLLTHYPLLWNLRIHWVWPVIIVLHLVFFSAGYVSVSLQDGLTWQTLRISGATASMAFLCGVLIGVLWLVFYFRNNAFKQFYPLPKGRLMGEFALIALTVFGMSSFAASYAGGAYGHVRALTQDTDIVREANVINLARHFIAFDKDDFRSSGDCRYQNRNEDVHTTVA